VEVSAPLLESLIFSGTEVVVPSDQGKVTPIFTSENIGVTVTFIPSLTFGQTQTLVVSPSFSASLSFAATEVFALSNSFKSSAVLPVTLPLEHSATFSAAVTVIIPAGTRTVINEGDDNANSSNSSSVAAAIGGSLGGLALLAVVVLFVLFNRKKKLLEDLPPVEAESMSGEAEFISEYGMSDGGHGVDRDEEGMAVPSNAGGSWEMKEEGSGASEHNPDGSDVVGVDDPDEGK
jgi:hypothetical protein